MTRLRWTIRAALCGVLLASASGRATAVTLDDFGYRQMTVKGVQASGTRPLLIVNARFSGEAAIAPTADALNQLVFGTGGHSPNLSDWGRSNSNGRFHWVPAQAEHYVLGQDDLGPLPGSDAAIRKAVVNALVKKNFDFRKFIYRRIDPTGPARLGPSELGILVFATGAGAQTSPVETCDDSGNICPGISDVGGGTHLPKFTHETTHQLGTVDIYGTWQTYWPGGVQGSECLSHYLSLMSCPDGGDTDTYQLDPWHKLVLGWVEPRIFDLSKTGIATVPAADSGDPTAPIILYDSTRPFDPATRAREFFIVEYRTKDRPGASGYDADIPEDGAAIWHILGNGAVLKEVAPLPNLDPDAPPTAKDRVDFLDGPPNLVRGPQNLLWAGGRTTPFLRWLDGSTTKTRLTFRIENPSAQTMQVSWTALDLIRGGAGGDPLCPAKNGEGTTTCTPHPIINDQGQKPAPK